MSNILIAIATLTVGFMLATYGAYTGYHAVKRAEYTTRVSNGFEQSLVYVAELSRDLGRMPTAAEVDAQQFEKHEGFGIEYRYGSGINGGVPYFWVCALAPADQSYLEEAFRKVADQRTGTLFGDDCQNNGVAGTNVAITMLLEY